MVQAARHPIAALFALMIALLWWGTLLLLWLVIVVPVVLVRLLNAYLEFRGTRPSPTVEHLTAVLVIWTVVLVAGLAGWIRGELEHDMGIASVWCLVFLAALPLVITAVVRLVRSTRRAQDAEA
jgi:hypothetical protein